MKKAGKPFRILFLIWLCLSAGLLSGAETAPEGFRFVKEAGGILEYELAANGLRVLLMEKHSAPVVTVLITYPAGPRNEVKGRTEASHFIEHLMFKGTARFNRREGTSIPVLLEDAGAMLNATTGMDGTCYYEMVPRDQLALALDIEADRMRGALLRDADIEDERRVLLNEYEKNMNSPLFALEEAVWKKAFLKHPYQNGIAGIRRDIEKITHQELREFYGTHYWPENAVLTVIGDFETDGLLALVREKFGTVPKSAKPVPGVKMVEPVQKKARHVRVKFPGRFQALVTAHKIPPACHPDIPALDVLNGILASGKTSRFYGRLVEQGLAVEVNSVVEKLRDPGLFVTTAVLSSGVKHKEAEKAVLEVLDAVKKDGVTTEELARVKNQLRVKAAFARDSSFSIAGEIGQAVSAGDWTLFPSYLERVQAVSPEDIRRVARLYFDPEGMTVGSLIQGKTGKKRPSAPGLRDSPEEAATGEAKPISPRPETAGLRKNDLKIGLQDRMLIKNAKGVRVICVKTDGKDAAVVQGSFRGGGKVFSENPLLAALTAEMLDKGTQGRDRIEIARILEDRGIWLSFGTDEKRAGFRARALREDVPLVIDLVAEQFRTPKFDPDEFDKIKERMRVGIRQRMSDTASLGANELSRMIYTPTHPNYEISFEDELIWLERTTLDDVRAFYDRNYGPEDFIIVAAGDIEPAAVFDSVERTFKGWEKKMIKSSYDGSVSPGEPLRRVVPVKGGENIDVFFGQGISLTRLSEDYLPAFMANYIFGGNFSARLSIRLRDELGLTYGVYSRVTGVSEDVEGHWLIRLISTAAELDRGIEEVRKQAELFVEKGVTEEELSRKKNTAIGRFKVDLAGTENLAGWILTCEELGLGAGYLEKYPALLDEISIEKVNQAILKYFHPSEFQIAIAGDTAKEDKN